MTMGRALARNFSLFLSSILLISGCSSGNAAGSGSFNIESLQEQVMEVAPNCFFEKINIAKEGEIKGDIFGVVENVVLENFLYTVTDFGGLLENEDKLLATSQSSGWSKSPNENIFTWNLNSIKDIYVCNTNGLQIDELLDWDQNNREQDLKFSGDDFRKCEFYEPYDKDDATRAQNCLEILRSLSRNGEWIVVTTFEETTPKDIITQFMKSHSEQFIEQRSAKSRSPMAYTDQFTLSLAKSGFYQDSDSIKKKNTFWMSLIQALKATPWSNLDASGAGFVDEYTDQELDYEVVLQEVISFESKVNENVCSNVLKISENTATSSDCGKLNVEVFQSDLNTGECQFLAYWQDNAGSNRTGIFNYCNAFTPGSIREDNNYTLRVRVVGPETYRTAAGAQNTVLSFTVLGE